MDNARSFIADNLHSNYRKFTKQWIEDTYDSFITYREQWDPEQRNLEDFEVLFEEVNNILEIMSKDCSPDYAFFEKLREILLENNPNK